MSREDQMIIKIQSKCRQFLAVKRVEELKKRQFISEKQKKLENNKAKVEALRVISQMWVLFREARRMAQA